MTSISMMDPTFLAAILSPALPLSAFVAIMLLFRRCPRVSARLSITAVTGSLICALFLFVRHWDALTPIVFSRPWMISDAIQIPIGFMLDPLSLLMLTIVTGISCLVQIYSLGYMAGDPGFARYYAYMSLFAWAMISLVLAPSLFQLYVFWELVGLASYLLIGFWYDKFSASRAGKKAFVMTRLGDAAFLLGLMIILVHVGNLEITTLNGPEPLPGMSPGLITLAALLIFGGIIGKSAQFPLLTWLPDAMEGPTPVSALLHSATMVAAGVYLLARLFPFFSLSTTAMTVCLAVGTISMLMASTMALVSRDIKQVWAYSTISQLGFMIMGLGAGGYVAGVFHLTTHAAFKALLFLCSGVFIHALGTNDMVAIGQAGGRRMRLPIVCMTLGAASLAGLPPFSGFFSKELILSVLAGQTNPLWLTAGLAGAFLTAYYAFRLIFTILVQPSGPDSMPAHTSDPHPRDRHSETWMAIPLVILTTLTLVLG
ncbi:MAG: NADH-quinone oxidoreductase subunit L, partial [Desulfatirhabdiaceae bacterium]